MRLAAELKDRVTILQRINVRDQKFGTDKATWVPLATVWAGVQDVLPGRADRIANDVIDIAKRPCRVRIRYRTDITGAMRLLIRGREYRIVSGPAELGRRIGLEMLAEELSTEGQRP